ncbi:MAG: Crp/Fnr family transcriptional regulator [Syntrophobacteraceae bacterium]
MDSSTGQDRTCNEYNSNVDLLRHVPFFSAMPLEAVKVLACMCTRELFKAGDLIFAQDEIDEHAYLILAGTAELLLRTELGEESIRFCGESEFIGSFSLLSIVKRLFSLRARTDVQCIVLERERFQRTLDQFPDSAGGILQVVTSAIHQWEYTHLHGHGRLCAQCKAGVGITLI